MSFDTHFWYEGKYCFLTEITTYDRDLRHKRVNQMFDVSDLIAIEGFINVVKPKEIDCLNTDFSQDQF